MSKKAPFVAGNWKMHATLAEARALVAALVAAAPGLGDARLVVIPPFTALSEAAKLTAGTAVGLGGQNLHWEDKGAFTGEISGPMLKDAGCAYVVIGHSERRQFFGETDATVNRKIRAALRHGLDPHPLRRGIPRGAGGREDHRQDRRPARRRAPGDRRARRPERSSSPTSPSGPSERGGRPPPPRPRRSTPSSGGGSKKSMEKRPPPVL